MGTHPRAFGALAAPECGRETAAVSQDRDDMRGERDSARAGNAVDRKRHQQGAAELRRQKAREWDDVLTQVR